MRELLLNNAEYEAIKAIESDNLIDPVGLIRRLGFDCRIFFRDHDWSGMDFRGSDITGVSFNGSILSGIKILTSQKRLILETNPRFVSFAIVTPDDVFIDTVNQDDAAKLKDLKTVTPHRFLNAERLSEHELQEIDLGINIEILRGLDESANALLSGSRGAGKTFLLRKLKQTLESRGQTVVFVRAGASNQPLLISLALACSLHLEKRDVSKEKILELVTSEHKVSQADAEELMSIIERASVSATDPVDTIIIDDVHCFGEHPIENVPISNPELLSLLLRQGKPRIVASISTILGSNKFASYGNLTAMPGHDYHELSIDAGLTDRRLEQDKNITEQLLDRDEKISRISEHERDHAAEYLAGINIRRKQKILNDLSQEFHKAKKLSKVLKFVHDANLTSYFDEFHFIAQTNLSSHEVFRQLTAMAEKINEQRLTTSRRLQRLGRVVPISSTSAIAVNFAKEKTIVSILLQLGMVYVISHGGKETRIKFANKHDENWFVSKFSKPDGDDGNGGQLRLF